MASGTTMRGTVIANNAAIEMNTGDTLEGRALSTAGAITVDGILAYMPIGCGSPVLTGPSAPTLASTECYAIFSTDGPVTNTGITYATGDVGSNVGLTTGYNALYITGTLHAIPDGSTTQCAADLLTVYNYLNALPYDIELLYPAQFGHNLVLTPHTYLLNAATVFTDTLYLNALGDANAVFVIKIYGALSTSTYSKVILINQAQAKNVYWKVDGAVDISDYSVFNGTIVSAGAVDLRIGVRINGRAQTIVGALNTDAVTVIAQTNPSGCVTVGIPTYDAANANEAVSIYPNPFSMFTSIKINADSQIANAEFRIYNILGSQVMSSGISKHLTTLNTSSLASGIYFFKVIANNKTIQTGKLISEK
jgi:hypothetical protein